MTVWFYVSYKFKIEDETHSDNSDLFHSNLINRGDKPDSPDSNNSDEADVSLLGVKTRAHRKKFLWDGEVGHSTENYMIINGDLPLVTLHSISLINK